MEQQPKATPWHYRPVTDAAGSTTFNVFEGETDDSIVNVRKESSAFKIVDSANMSGYPDVSAMVDDEED